jgi:glycosyltransferase involved in cell wall biosynthesis
VTAPDLSIVVPAHNEEESILPLHQAIVASMARLARTWELVVVDDGSTDRTFGTLCALQQTEPRLTIVRLGRNRGQSSALNAGFRHARGRIIVTMDADLQNDPNDIPLLLDAIEQRGLDVAVGWRWQRRDPIGKRFFSRLANALRRVLTGSRIHDAGCSLKACRRECLTGLPLYGDRHRFLPDLLHWRGFRVGELRVNHQPRRHGRTKYGPSRLATGLLDLLVLVFWMHFGTKPVHFFGLFGIATGLGGAAVALYLSAEKLLTGAPLAGRPLLLLAVMLILVGLQLLLFGFLAETFVAHDFRSFSPDLAVEVRHSPLATEPTHSDAV